jgi:23S rRNA (guanine2445-N2)-methyltransferase / 23S rRNA (guanine2069-N7)-methyltransferase
VTRPARPAHDRTWFATCPKGLEYLLRDELSALGAGDAHEALAGVRFGGDPGVGYRACLWSRLASRVLLAIARFDAPDDAALYDGVRAIDWSEHLAPQDTLAVDASSHASALVHTRFLAQRVKDAVVDQFRERCGTRPGVDTEQPSIRLNLHLDRDRATLSLDFSGTPLHRRGWRTGQGEAPLKENLACAILLRGGWPALAAAGATLVDPMCGAATLPIEAALMAADRAPGLAREYFGFLGWRGHDAAQWQALIDEAQARAATGLARLPATFFGFDADPAMRAIGEANVAAAGLAGKVQLATRAVDALAPPPGCAAGLVVCNPPYGQRLGEQERLAPLYRALGERLKLGFAGWQAAVITADAGLAQAIGLAPRKRYVLFNGALECRLLVCDIAAPETRGERVLSPGAQAVANRIAGNARHLRKRLAREGIGCYRVYDADLPEYATAIDVYTAIGPDAGGNEVSGAPAAEAWLHVQEYAAPPSIPEHVARVRLGELLRAAGIALDVPRARIALKKRRRGRGGAAYGRLDERGEFLLVEEGGLRLRVNLFDYLDTGLFLDHRPTRLALRARARDTRFLNLFSYTATATVHAAAGGAASTTSVDLSPTYLEWAARNLELNGFAGARHQLVQADVMQWLAHERGRYDLIFVDPPTFSNSSRAADFDVQRDHVELLRRCAARLADGGTLVFSTNNRRFRLDREALAGFDIIDTSAASIPFDFARTPRIHQCYELRNESGTIS